MIKYVHYFVEGECEKKLIDALKTPPCNYLYSGKVEVFNVILKVLSIQRILSIKENALIVLVYDTDFVDTSKLEKNIKLLESNGFKNIIHIQSIKNFEDEIVFSSAIKSIHEIFSTQGMEEFKAQFIHCGNILNKLDSIKFNKDKIWTRNSNEKLFNVYNANKIEKLRKNNINLKK